MLKSLKKEVICAIFLILNGLFLLICPLLKIINLKYLFLETMVLYTIINLLIFCLNLKEKDYTSALKAIFSLLVAIISYVINVTTNPKYFAMTILLWTALMALVKLKKADFYHDKKNKLWILQIACLFIFLLSGVISSLNFIYGEETQIIVFGYFILITGIIEFFDPFLSYLTKGRIK